MSEEKGKEKEITRSNSNLMTGISFRENTPSFSGQNGSSSSSVKLKKSSNIFSVLVRKAKRKKTGNKTTNDAVKNLHISSQNLSVSSTMSLAAHIEEEVELNCQNYEKKGSQNQEMLWEGQGICSETNTSNHSDVSSNKTPRNIFSLRDTHTCNQVFKDDIAQTKCNNQYEVREAKNVACEYVNASSQEDIVLSSFINFEKPTLDVAHADALQYLQEVIHSFHESENHIINLLMKYVTDPNVQQEMRESLSNHTKLQWDAERRSCSLANDIWMQQLEIGRAQEKILQGTLHSLVKQNRQLQIENESLYRKYEKANRQLKGYSDHKTRYHECDSQVDSVLRRNEKLQTKLESVFKKIESLEGELHIFQKQNDTMEEQLRSSTVKIQHIKAALHAMKTDYEVEQVSLNFKLSSKEQILKEALEMGNIVLEDLDNIKRQFKNLPFGVNWSKCKVRGNCLTDLFHVCRSCISDLSKELINVYTDISLKDKDIILLREANKNLQENLKNSLTELNSMSKKVEENSGVTDEKQLLEQKCQMLEGELKHSQEKIEKLHSQFEGEKSNLLQNIYSHDKYLKELQDKDIMVEQTKLLVANITSQNYSLQNEIVALNRIIKETGAGDIVREIEHKHEELDFLRKVLDKARNENAQLKIQTETSQKENGALIANQEMAYKTLQRQVKELERLNEEIQNMKQKVETEHQTVLSLQSERMKYLEEKTILKSIIQHLKSELTKLRQLEDNLSSVSKEASKLGLMAEYNKQQGEKLKQEVSERDNTIAQLKSSMQKLNDIQMQNAKEKLSLCYELNEVSQLKEKLSVVLNTEVKKNEELGQSKEAMIKSVNSQIQKIEEKQRNERTAIRFLLKDIKTVAEEKENALKEKYKLQMEIEQLQVKISDLEEKYNHVTKDLMVKSEEVKELRKEIGRYEKRQKESNEKLENEGSKYELNLLQLKKLIDLLRGDKKNLENSNEYLKNNIEKLHKDLNQTRESEKSTIDILNRTKQEQEESKRLLSEQTRATKDLQREKQKLKEEKCQLITEKDNLIKETGCLNNLMDKVVGDFEKSIKTAEEKEKMFKNELEEAKHILYNYGKEIQDLQQSVEMKEKRIEELRGMEKNEDLHEKRYYTLKEEMKQLETECSNLKGSKLDLENQLSDVQEDYNKLTVHVVNLEAELQLLESQLKIVIDQKEDDYVFYKKHIADISKTREDLEEQNQKEISKLRLQLQDVTSRLDNEKSAYETLSQIHKEVSAKFMKSIKDLVEVKNSKQDIMEKVKGDKLNLENMENEKKELKTQIKELSAKLEKCNNQLKQTNEENKILQKNYTAALDRCTALENQMKQMEINHHQEYREVVNRVKPDDKQNEIGRLKIEREENVSTIHRLKMEISDLQKEITLLQLERSEIALQLHESKKKLETEKVFAEQMRNTQKLLLAAIMQLREEGKVNSADCVHLMHMMNFLSPSQLHSYESIINEIQSEHEKFQKLQQEIEIINNKLIISTLSELKLSEKIGYISVKIFSDIVELFSLYRDEINDDIHNFLKYENCKFYLLEIFITNALQRKLKDISWSLWLCVKSESICACKTIGIKQFEIPIIEVIPIDQNIIDCEVSAYIILHSKDSLTFVSLDSVTVNISYHFEPSKKTAILNRERKILEISKCHNPSLNILEIRKPLWVEYQFLTKIDNKELIKLFIKNCYHKMDLELFSELASDSKNSFVIKFSTGSTKHSVTFDKQSKIITLKSNVLDMIKLKNYFWNEDTLKIEDGDKLKKNLKHLLELLNQCTDEDELCTYYLTLRQVWIK